MPISPSALEFIPESVARKCNIVPLELASGDIAVLVDLNIADMEAVEKLRFITNRRITCFHASVEAIRFAIRRDYGMID